MPGRLYATQNEIPGKSQGEMVSLYSSDYSLGKLLQHPGTVAACHGSSGFQAHGPILPLACGMQAMLCTISLQPRSGRMLSSSWVAMRIVRPSMHAVLGLRHIAYCRWTRHAPNVSTHSLSFTPCSYAQQMRGKQCFTNA